VTRISWLRMTPRLPLSATVAVILWLTTVILHAAVIDNLTAYWTLDEASGNRLDSVASLAGVDVSNVGTVGSVTGKLSNAGSFVGANGQVLKVTDTAAISFAGDMTITAWVQLASKPSFARVAQKGTSGAYEYVLYYRSDTDRFEGYICSAAQTCTAITANSFGAPSNSTFYFLMLVHNDAADQIKISVNCGTQDTTAHAAGMWDGTSDLTIGADAAPTNGWDGLIDAVGFWRADKTSDCASLYNSGSGLEYPFGSGGSPASGGLLLRGVGN
jgi:hypothetical protein